MQDCGRTLICGHMCESKCSKSCPPCSKPCETACAHSQCSKAGSYDGQMKKLRKNPDHKGHRKQVRDQSKSNHSLMRNVGIPSAFA